MGGAQHVMAMVFSALTNPGDTVLTGELTYSGMKSLANFLHIRLRGLAMDEEGIRADALEAACATTDAKALYCMPTLQNPTAVVMSERRRQEIAAIAESYGLAVVEDDSYGFLLPEVKPLGAYVTTKKNFYYLTGTSKSLAPGLRIGYLLSPAEMVDRLAAAISATTFIASPVTAEIVTAWLENGTADQVMDWKRGEVRNRQKLARTWRSRRLGSRERGAYGGLRARSSRRTLLRDGRSRRKDSRGDGERRSYPIDRRGRTAHRTRAHGARVALRSHGGRDTG